MVDHSGYSTPTETDKAENNHENFSDANENLGMPTDNSYPTTVGEGSVEKNSNATLVKDVNNDPSDDKEDDSGMRAGYSPYLAPSYDGGEPLEEYKEQPDFGHLDLRVVTVLSLGLHPSPDDKVEFIEQVAIEKRTESYELEEAFPSVEQNLKNAQENVESGIPHLYELEDLVGFRTIALCNMKPTKTVRGLETKVVVLCARDGDKVDFLRAPKRASVGDPVTVSGLSHNPKTPYVEDFIKNFASDFRVNDKQEVLFRGKPLRAGPKEEVIMSTSFKNCAVGNIMNLDNF